MGETTQAPAGGARGAGPGGGTSPGAFDALPPAMRLRAFGVDYGHLRPAEGGDLYVTRHGWPLLGCLRPASWYADRWYAREGARLPGSTGHAYHVETRPVDGRRADLVVKFSRVAQGARVTIASTFPDDVPPEVVAGARFNSPFEEFGLVTELRRGQRSRRGARVLTQKPLAIYAPPDEFQVWQLGRDEWRFDQHDRLLSQDQEGADKAIELDIKRIYVMLYGWIKGRDAEEWFTDGALQSGEFHALVPRVIEELRGEGFRVLDNKPKHFILRRRRDGSLLRRDGRLVYGLVDFELLQRTPESQRSFKELQRRRYLDLDAEDGPAPPEVPAHLRTARVFGVPYVFGRTPDGGQLWIVGRDPDLFDYYLPDRWRRTPRVKLSPVNEVYRTRTRDGVLLVYRRSRVGTRPRVDPLLERGRRIRESGINSPFEEVAVARLLRELGVSATVPRAIYRTGHDTTRTIFLPDPRRFEDHAGLTTPDDAAEPILSRHHDYYTLWDDFHGSERGPAGRRRPMSVEAARESGLIDADGCDELLGLARRRLHRAGVGEAATEDRVLCVAAAEDGGLARDERGDVAVWICLDALTAYDFGLLDDAAYQGLIARLEARLRAVDCEALNLGGNHIVLQVDPDGLPARDESGEIEATLSNFELIRGLYRPLR